MTKKSMIGVIAVRSSTTVSLPRNSSHVRAIWQASARLLSRRAFCFAFRGAVVVVVVSLVVSVALMGKAPFNRHQYRNLRMPCGHQVDDSSRWQVRPQSGRNPQDWDSLFPLSQATSTTQFVTSSSIGGIKRSTKRIDQATSVQHIVPNSGRMFKVQRDIRRSVVGFWQHERPSARVMGIRLGEDFHPSVFVNLTNTAWH
ncbi:MAG: hypothetical protein JWP89_473 [Schlesneria sp.]|nr:hypothetical protein [Schlesneria sp.]